MNPFSREPRAPIDLLTNALFVGAGLLLLYALLAWMVARPAFALHHVEVRGHLSHVDQAQVQLLVSRNLRGNFFTVDLNRVRDDFEKLPWVDNARIARHWPDRLIVELTEHQALGVWNAQRLVSTTGEVFNASVPQALPHLNGVEGTGAEVSAAYLKFSALLSPLGLHIQQLSLSPRRAWQLKAASDTDLSSLEISLGRTEPEARLARFASQYPTIVARLGAAPTYADLRYADGFALRAPAQTLVKQL